MALLGTLSGFGLTEIFQLIAQQMKSGALVLNGPRKEVVVVFEDGAIRGMASEAWSGDPRVKLLIEGGFLTEKAYRQAVEQAERQGCDWITVLIEQNRLSPGFFEKAADLIIRETVLEVFQWKEGGYRFDDSQPSGRLLLKCDLPAEGLILDTLRVIDEWPLIKSRLPSVDYCPVRLLPLTEELVRQFDLGPIEMRIYDLIDDTKTVETIVRESLETRFNALSAFVRLLDGGLIETFPAGSLQRQQRSEFWRQAERGFKLGLLTVLLAAVTLGLAAGGQSRLLHKRWADARVVKQLELPRQIAGELNRQGIRLSELTSDTRVR